MRQSSKCRIVKVGVLLPWFVLGKSRRNITTFLAFRPTIQPFIYSNVNKSSQLKLLDRSRTSIESAFYGLKLEDEKFKGEGSRPTVKEFLMAIRNYHVSSTFFIINK